MKREHGAEISDLKRMLPHTIVARLSIFGIRHGTKGKQDSLLTITAAPAQNAVERRPVAVWHINDTCYIHYDFLFLTPLLPLLGCVCFLGKRQRHVTLT